MGVGRLRRFSRRLLLLCCSLLVLAGLIEVFLRLFTEQGIQLLVKDELVGQRYRAGIDRTVHVPEAGRRVRLRFNDRGFRGPDWKTAAAPGARRLAVLGDSFTVAVAVDEQDTMAARLAQQLGPGWETQNFGVSGYGTGQALLVWRHFAKAYAPDLVLLNFSVWNDLADNCRKLTSSHRPYFDLDPSGDLVLHGMSPLRTKLSRWLSHSRFYVWQKNLFKQVRRATRTRLSDGLRILDSDPTGDVATAWAITEALIAQLHAEVTAAGATFVFRLHPRHGAVRTPRRGNPCRTT